MEALLDRLLFERVDPFSTVHPVAASTMPETSTLQAQQAAFHQSAGCRGVRRADASRSTMQPDSTRPGLMLHLVAEVGGDGPKTSIPMPASACSDATAADLAKLAAGMPTTAAAASPHPPSRDGGQRLQPRAIIVTQISSPVQVTSMTRSTSTFWQIPLQCQLQRQQGQGQAPQSMADAARAHGAATRTQIIAAELAVE